MLCYKVGFIWNPRKAIDRLTLTMICPIKKRTFLINQSINQSNDQVFLEPVKNKLWLLQLSNLNSKSRLQKILAVAIFIRHKSVIILCKSYKGLLSNFLLFVGNVFIYQTKDLRYLEDNQKSHRIVVYDWKKHYRPK